MEGAEGEAAAESCRVEPKAGSSEGEAKHQSQSHSASKG